MSAHPIYLDHMATTPLCAEAREAMLPWLGERVGNPSSTTHPFGWEAAEAVERARREVALLIGAPRSACVVFTSGATESNNTVIKGALEVGSKTRGHVVTTAIEHPSVLAPCEAMVAAGVGATVVLPDAEGITAPEQVAAGLRPETGLVSVMAVNNEVGTVQPLAEILEITREHGIVVHVDASQGVGKIELDVAQLGIDFFSISAHKINGPIGIGALFVASPDKLRLPALMHGGGQERGLRSGTLPVAQIAGFGAAARAARLGRADFQEHASRLGDALLGHLESEIVGLGLNGSRERRLPSCLNVSIAGIHADTLIAALPGLAISSGSACSTSRGGGSHVLRAMGLSHDRRGGAVRISFGPSTTLDEILDAAEQIKAAVAKLRLRSVGAVAA